MARLVVVSNRIALPRERGGAAGGLAVAMRDALRRGGGLWFGWSGELNDEAPTTPQIVTAGKVVYATMDLSHADHRAYYLGYANSVLWPLFHYRLGLFEFRRDTFEGYLRVNAAFAAALAPLLQADDLIWVHDYHLIPLAAELRKRGVQNRIGFFLHIPFPTTEVLTALPGHERLVEALCAYDLIGFQTANDLRAFADYIVNEARGEMTPNGAFTGFGRHGRAGAFPISIDTDGFARTAEHAADAPDMQRMRESLVGRALIIGVDRLDYSKGLPHRFEAFDQLMERWREHRSRVTLMQVAPPTRGQVAQYRALRRELEGLAGHVNGKYAEFDWVPIRYLNKTFSRNALAGFYRMARIGLVTPLRDGMNLVAKEYVAAQDGNDPGVLVLSRFAGAAREMDGALIVNPFDVEAMAEALHRALAMPLDERQKRWREMMEILRRNNIGKWREDFLRALRDDTQAKAAA
ncbi:MAG TPA: alpha,alpha-trehalose-phosphate synthase (UDP-forming) [Candidatus Acidoferrum sp.]|nr:alpha,alpha-trehalose-phosphate synthase (UDP-forming) [Candidatus Acidoferrum sp.]